MPIAYSKHDRCTIYLDSDLERPEDERVGFLCRFITTSERREVKAITAELLADLTANAMADEEFEKKFNHAIAIGVIGPINAKHPRTGAAVPCTLAGIEDVLNTDEQWRLLLEYPDKLRPTAEEKKTSESVTASSTAATASAAATAPATNPENAGSAKTEFTD